MSISLDRLQAISDWAQEARREPSQKYFYQIDEFDQIDRGRAYFVIGRKGTGKTALGAHLLSLDGKTALAEPLSFRNFPFQELYRLREGNGGAPRASEYMSAWRYILYCAVCKMMSRNPRIAASLRQRLAKAFPTSPTRALSSEISHWTAGGINIAELFEINATREVRANPSTLNERADALEAFILENIDQATYYIVLDSLDDDYRSENRSNDYFILLAGLFKTVEEISEKFDPKRFRAKILPVVLLRDDIFKFVKDNDREKWDDLLLKLLWDDSKIKSVLAHRICRSLEVDPVDFRNAWLMLVREPSFSHFGEKTDKFDFITKYTLRRPRDYVYYLKDAATKTIARARNQGHKETWLGGQVLRDSAGSFATHLRDEIEDELGGQFDNPRDLLDCLLDVGKILFRAEDFKKLYNERSLEAKTGMNHLESLHLLFELSAIGFVPKHRPAFRYLEPDLKLQPDRTLALHTGLVRAQQMG